MLLLYCADRVARTRVRFRSSGMAPGDAVASRKPFRAVSTANGLACSDIRNIATNSTRVIGTSPRGGTPFTCSTALSTWPMTRTSARAIGHRQALDAPKTTSSSETTNTVTFIDQPSDAHNADSFFLLFLWKLKFICRFLNNGDNHQILALNIYLSFNSTWFLCLFAW